MSIQPLIEVWKQMRPHIESGLITTTSTADHCMKRLANSYRTHRRQVRSAELNFKHEFTGGTIPGLSTVPMEHQVRAFGFGSTIDASALLMEQGTGKTYVAIALIHHRVTHNRVKKILIIPPKSVVPVWSKELLKHANFEYSIDRVPKSKTPIRDNFGPGVQILVCNYDKIPGRRKELSKWKPDMIILDESHRIKNRQAKRSKACHLLGREVKFKLILTGTLLGQQLVDAFSQYLFLDSNVFGRQWKLFEEAHLKMGGYMGYEIRGYKDIELFAKLLHSVAFRCTKEECLDLPEQMDENLYVEPTPEIKRIYAALDSNFEVDIGGEELTVGLVVTKMMKLRQITGGLVKVDDGTMKSVGECKLPVLKEFLEAHSFKRKLVIVTSFTHEIEMIGKMLNNIGRNYIVLNGATPDEERENIEKRFTEDFSLDILILQVDTGGEGLDFTAADTMIFYSPTFSMIKYFQVKARLHRIGQTNPVTYYHLLMEGTIDEKILDFIQEYGDLTTQVLDDMKGYEMDLEEALDKVNKDLKKQKQPKREETTMATAKKKVVKKKTSASTGDKPGYTASDMAKELVIDPAHLRAALRAIKAKKPGKSWGWKNAKEASSVKKEVATWLKNAPKAGRPATKTKAKPKAKTKAKATTKKKVKKKKK